MPAREIQGEVLRSKTERPASPLYEVTVHSTGIDPQNLFAVLDGAGRDTGSKCCDWPGHAIYGF